MTSTLTIEMKWKQAARVCLATLENGTEKGKQMARDEIMRMADAADFAVDLQRELARLQAALDQANGAAQ